MEWHETPEGKIQSMQMSLQIISMLLGKYSQDNPTCLRPFKTPAEMAQYFKLMIDILLPEEMRYKESELLQISSD